MQQSCQDSSLRRVLVLPCIACITSGAAQLHAQVGISLRFCGWHTEHCMQRIHTLCVSECTLHEELAGNTCCSNSTTGCLCLAAAGFLLTLQGMVQHMLGNIAKQGT